MSHSVCLSCCLSYRISTNPELKDFGFLTESKHIEAHGFYGNTEKSLQIENVQRLRQSKRKLLANYHRTKGKWAYGNEIS